MLNVHINGELQIFPQDTLHLSELVNQMGLANKRFAIEYNGRVVPKSQLQKVYLASGDKLEIITAVGGG